MAELPPVKLAILGHPRSGTGYMAALLDLYGLSIGHEVLARDGISSFKWVADAKGFWRGPKARHLFGTPRNGRKASETWMVTRCPLGVIASSVHTLHRPSWDYMAAVIPGGLPRTRNPIEKAAASWLGLNRLILSMCPDWTVKVEDAASAVPRRLGLMTKAGGPAKDFNGRTHPSISLSDLRSLVQWPEIEEMTCNLGYLLKEPCACAI